MSRETREQIFNPYFTTKNSGTGLGMAIVQKIIEAHNGEITVSSVEGKGTVITIHIPKK
jgi:signal transduction histidine kinase